MGQSRVKEGGGYSFITVVSLKGWNPTCGFGAEAIENGKYNNVFYRFLLWLKKTARAISSLKQVSKAPAHNTVITSRICWDNNVDIFAEQTAI